MAEIDFVWGEPVLGQPIPYVANHLNVSMFSRMKVTELRNLCKSEWGGIITGYSKMNKSQLVQVLDVYTQLDESTYYHGARANYLWSKRCHYAMLLEGTACRFANEVGDSYIHYYALNELVAKDIMSYM